MAQKTFVTERSNSLVKVIVNVTEISIRRHPHLLVLSKHKKFDGEDILIHL